MKTSSEIERNLTDVGKIYMLQKHALAAEKLIDPESMPRLYVAVQALITRLKQEIEEEEARIKSLY